MEESLKSLYNKCKGWSLEKYVRDHLLVTDDITPLSEEAFEAFQKNFKSKEPVRVASTAAHVGIIQWDVHHFISETVLANFMKLLSGGESIPILVFDSIPFTNTTRPGLIDLSNLKSKTGGNAGKFVFRGRSHVYASHAPPISQEEIDRFMKKFKKVGAFEGHFPTLDKGRFDFFCERVESIPEYGKTFRNQALKFSSDLWPYLFDDELAKEVDPLWSALFDDLELYETNIFADKKSRDVLLDMQKKYKLWCHAPNYFKGMCKCGRPFPLDLKDEGGKTYLQGKCESPACGHGNQDYSVEVGDIPEAVKKRELRDTLFIRFYKLWALAGIDTVGGCGQIEYLARYKEAYIELLTRTGRKDEAALLAKRKSNKMLTSIFAPLNRDGTPKSGTQTLLEGGLSRDFLTSLSKMKFGKLLDLENIYIDSFLWGLPADYGKARSMVEGSELEGLVF